MPGYIGNYSPTGQTESSNRVSTLACKLVTSFPDNARLEPKLPSILATIMLFDIATGLPKAVLCGTEITTWRTVAASLVATKHLWFARHKSLAREPKLAIIGAGVQGRMHAIGMVNTFKVASVQVWNRTRSKADDVVREIQALGVNASFVETVEECVDAADIIVTATYSSEPLVKIGMLKKGVHINGNGNILHFKMVVIFFFFVQPLAQELITIQNWKVRFMLKVKYMLTQLYLHGLSWPIWVIRSRVKLVKLLLGICHFLIQKQLLCSSQWVYTII